MKKNIPTLRQNATLKEAIVIAEYMYTEVLKQFEEFTEEKWYSEDKIRRTSNDLIFFIAQAVGTSTTDTTEYDWSNARKNLLSLQTIYIFANKQGFIELEPSIVNRIDNLIMDINDKIDNSKKEYERITKNEMKPWLEKYRLWKEMHNESPNIDKND
jgi:hypothetical protein